MKKIFFITSFLLLNTIICKSQTNEFRDGFIKGFNSHLKENGVLNGISYLDYLNNNDCPFKTYVNDPKANEKIYFDGYNCGIVQAVKALSNYKNSSNKNYQDLNSRPKSANEIDEEILNLKKKMQDASPEVSATYQSMILALEQEKSNNKIVQSSNSYSSYSNSTSNNLEENNNINEMIGYYQKQQQMQNQYNLEIQNQLNSFANDISNQFQAIAIQQAQIELQRRQKTANNFINYHSNALKTIYEQYQQIPIENFKINLNGKYSAYLVENETYSFLNNNYAKTVTPVLAEIENNKLINVYEYGIESMKNNFLETISYNKIINGVVKLSQNTSIILIEPFYMNSSERTYSFNQNVSYITFWTNNKEEVGKAIYVQQLDKSGNIIREFKTRLKYSKNKKTAETDELPKIPVLPDLNFLFFGEPTPTGFGLMPLHLKVDKKNYEESKVGEHKFVEIKKYRG